MGSDIECVHDRFLKNMMEQIKTLSCESPNKNHKRMKKRKKGKDDQMHDVREHGRQTKKKKELVKTVSTNEIIDLT